MAVSRGSLLNRAVRRVLRQGDVIRQAEFVTFKPKGFVAAENPPELLGRHYYEVMHLRRSLGLMTELNVKPGRSLEIGCGFGRLSPYIAEHFEQHTAVDINNWALSQASQFYPHVAFSSASATELPFPEHSFDAVITWTVLQHVPNSLIDKALKEIKRVAKSNSLLILCEATLNAATPQEDGQHTHDRFPEFYAKAFPSRSLLVSEFIGEIDRIPSMASPGRIMVFGPAS
ncbi:MAG: class I SAM-dependent methyltransferase [Acidobacteria bacterium]|nr:class I SAM-dependent methyltransferase [Acidobacteriota bacterium]